MSDEIDWSVTTYEGNRRRQHEEFRALSFREKLLRVEQMGDVVRHFALLGQRRRSNRGRDDGGGVTEPKGAGA